MKIKKLFMIVLFILLLGIGCKQNNNTNTKCQHEIASFESKKATCTKEGNLEYYYCTKCNKYYADKELTQEKTYDELVIAKTNHIESDWIIDTEATCTNQGLKHKECTICKEKLQEEVIEETEHNYTETIINPTCEEKGYTLYICSCGDEYKDNYVDKLGHKEEVIPGVDATCTKPGLTEGKKCLVCNKILEPQTEIKAKGHNYTETIISPTCEEEGYTLYKCHCGDEYKDNYVDKLGHKEEVIPGIEATCTKPGLTEGKKCSVCDKILEPQTEIKAKGHSYTDTIINPSCEEQGYTLHKCHCGDEYKDNYVASLSHNYNTGNIVLIDNGNKAVTRYNCSNCTNYKEEVYTGYYLLNDEAYEFNNSGSRVNLNKSFIEVKGNTYYVINNIIVKNYYIVDGVIYDFGNDGIKQDTVLTDKVITIDNNKYYVINNVIQKNIYIVYEQKVYYFNEDGKTILNMTYNGYVFGSDGYLIGSDILIEINGKLYYVINNIAAIHEHSIEHISYKEQTCTEDGNIEYYYCTTCNRYYKDSSYTKEITYNDTIIKASHSITKYNGKESTCTEQGYKAYETCSKCSYTTFEYLPLKEHALTDWIIDTEATCTKTGNKHKECSACKKIIETETIKALGHNYENGKCSLCGKTQNDSTGSKMWKDNGYIYFGEYPQTLKEESVTIISNTPDSDGYYLGSDGERYAKVIANPYSSSYYFNGNTSKIVKGTTYYFKVEPIRWRIEEENNDTYKLICDLVIDCQMYHSSISTRTIDGQTIYANNYKYSDIRSWLNNEFLSKAFTEDLQEYINVTEVDNSALSTGYSENEYACENTMDKIYLPSRSEMLKAEYGYSTSSSSYDTARQKQLTDYAKAIGCSMNTSDNYYNNGYYWLRSPDYGYSNFAYSVSGIGYVYYYDFVNLGRIGVAPALTIQID